MISARDVAVAFSQGWFKPKIRALDGFSVSVEPGDVFGLLGPNGAGKSTAMYCFLGLIAPDRGAVRVRGESPDPGSPLFRRIAYVPEDPHYHEYLTVREALDYYAALYGMRIPGSKVGSALERVGLAESQTMRISHCSKGMKQKVGLAACLLGEPDLVFLDEPTRGLDPLAVKEFRDVIVEMNRRGATFVINSHVLSEVEMVCTRVAIMNKGRVALQDRTQNLLKYDLESYTVEFSSAGQAPSCVGEAKTEAGRTRGIVPAARLGEFLGFIAEKRSTLYECSLKRLTLEDAFFDVLHQGPGHG
ncbi:MAG: ABC transporter ATP-binding protein [Elusimicrobia bacterium]|nr:ABC transporter ATP-binding protein [Elusimicrobiota bacterium]